MSCIDGCSSAAWDAEERACGDDQRTTSSRYERGKIDKLSLVLVDVEDACCAWPSQGDRAEYCAEYRAQCSRYVECAARL